MKTVNLLKIVLIICFLGILANAQNKIPQDSLVAYYPFDNDFNDKSGNNFNGKVTEAILTGSKNKACLFNGRNAFIEISGIEPLKTVKQLSISCWIKPFSEYSYDAWISKANDNNFTSQWRLSFGANPDNFIDLTIYNGHWTDYNSNFQLEIKKWYHVLYLIDNMNHKASIYINGKNIKSFDIRELSTSNGPLLIGYQKDDGRFYNGLVAELLIYSRLLKEGEIQMLYDNFKNTEKAELDPMLTAAIQRAEEIHPAVAAGDLNKVRALIEADSTLLESKDKDGNTPLHSACLSKQINIAEFLIEKGAIVNSKNNSGFTPLQFVSSGSGQYVNLIQKLIEKGADVNARLDRGLTSLHFAAMQGNTQVMKVLIDNGADVNACDVVCYGTVLQTAINICADESTAELLVESGAKINQKYSYGNTELHLAAIKGYADLVSLLIQHNAEVNAMNEYNHTALFYAASLGYRRAADALISAGADKSTIVEENYSEAPQLKEKLKDDEAYLWYLGGAYGGGYAIKTKQHLVIFDKTGIDESPEARLANGKFKPDELAGQNITVLITKALGLNYEKNVFSLAKQIPGINWIFDSKPGIIDSNNTIIPPHHLGVPYKKINLGGILIHAIPAIGRGYGGAVGMGYLVEADGIKIFHSGFHAPGYDASQIERYRREIDSLKSLGPIDIVILTVSGHLEVNYEPYLYLLKQLSPKSIYLMGGDAATEEYPKCVSILQSYNIPIKYPEGGRAIGERFHYVAPKPINFTDLYGDYLGQTPPGDTPVVFAPGIVSTIYMEHSTLTFSPDGNEVFWRVEWGPGLDRSLYNKDAWISNKTMKRIHNRWTVPTASPCSDRPVFSYDGKRLYFSDYYIKKQDNTWSERKNLGLLVRFPELKSIYEPSITLDGTLYFSSDTAGLGRIKDHVIYRAKLIDGEYTKLERLPRCINLPDSWNYSPFIARDESYIIFASNRPGSLDNSADLFISFHNVNEDSWSEPINLGRPINTPGQESSPGLSPDGKYLFYTSPVAGNQADIFWVSTKIIDRLREKSKMKK